MKKFDDIEQEINDDLGVINDFNNGNDKLVEEVEEIVKGIKKYTNVAISDYRKFNRRIIYLDIFVHIIYNHLSKNEEYQRLLQYCKDDLAFHLETVKKLKRYIAKCQRTGDVDNLYSAYIITIYLSYILDNISEYFKEINKVMGKLIGQFSYDGNQDIRYNAMTNIEVIKQLTKNIEEVEN